MKTRALQLVTMSILCVVGSGGCGKNEMPDMPPAPPAATPTPLPTEFGSKLQPAPPPVGTPEPAATPLSVAIRVDACSLLTKEEVEAAVGHKVLAPEKDEAANSCYYGDPEAGMEDGRAVSQLVTVTVFAAAGEMRDGASVPAREAFEMTKKNAASIQEIVGLKEEAYWDSVLQSMHVLRGNYSIEINIAAENAEFAGAKKLVEKVLAKLP